MRAFPLRNQDPPSLTLILPVYNGARFLRESLDAAATFASSLDRDAELLIVDDHSTDETPRILEQFVAECRIERVRATVLTNSMNRGKGFSVRRGLLTASGEFIVFSDADLTYPLDNVLAMLSLLEEGVDVAYGSRMHADSRYVVAPSFFGSLFSRHVSGRIFNLIVRIAVLPGVLDTQAGLKGFRRAAGRKLATRVRLDRFSFDVELLFVARRLGLRMEPSAVQFIYHKAPSTVRFARDSITMLRDILRVRWRGMCGYYERPLDVTYSEELFAYDPPLRQADRISSDRRSQG